MIAPPRVPLPLPLLLILILVVAVVHVAVGEQCDVKCPPAWMTDATTTRDSTPTLVDFFARDDRTLAAVRDVTAFFDRLGPRLQHVDERYDMPRLCTTGKSDPSAIAARLITAHRGFGCMEECLWKVHHASTVETEHQTEAKRLFDIAKLVADATVDAGLRFNKASDLGFKFVTSPQFMLGSTDTNQCEMVKVSAQRVDERWLLRSTIYDLENPYQSEKRGKTLYLQMMYLDDAGKLKHYPFNMTYCKTPRDPRTRFHESATALISKWDEKPSWSDWRTRNISENPAIRQGMMDNEISAAIFSEIDTPSGMAIFLLPLVLALAPAALFNNIRGKRDLAVYIALDVVAAVPLALKSFEFLTESRSAKYFAESLYYGSQNYTGAASAELFLAHCGFVNWYVELGKGLLMTTIVLTVLCISLDVYFYRLLMRKKRDYLTQIRLSAGNQSPIGSSSLSSGALDEIIAELPGSDLRWFFSLEKRRKEKDLGGTTE